MTDVEHQMRGWWERLMAWLRGPRPAEAGRKAAEALQDLRDSNTGRKAESALRDLRKAASALRPASSCRES